MEHSWELHSGARPAHRGPAEGPSTPHFDTTNTSPTDQFFETLMKYFRPLGKLSVGSATY
ncbi:hypothetical protein EYF80_041757 [Liparis tanakae]|uniref:Uncharacterized protein n=1 Tax=Liparis tanakae TaxID=230148 RepID=A0A4Z2G632_9TELE|nr:hypothetical protein EYF80_041757 [Liparis tanakae]